jgi:hypothetical protein
MTAHNQPDSINQFPELDLADGSMSARYPSADSDVSSHSFEQRGTQVQRAVRALVFGCVAAAAGSVLYSVVFALTGFEFGFLAVAVGAIVGAAVRMGSRRRGGPAYQALAIALTYAVIAQSYVPLVEKEVERNPAKEFVQHMASPGPAATPMLDTITISARGPEVGRAIDSAAAARRESEGFPVMQAGSPASTYMSHHNAPRFGFARIMLIAIVVPIAASFSSVISFVIIALALFAAWRLNCRVVMNSAAHYRSVPVEG